MRIRTGLKRAWRLPGEVLEGDPAAWILHRRGYDPDLFVRTDLTGLLPYFEMDALDEAAGLVASHIKAGHKILVVADYDCDGLTSAAQFSMFLQDIGYRDFTVVVPTREESYGVPMRAIQEGRGAGLMVAMDCGSLDHEPVSAARKAGMDVVVIDHHEVKGETAPASFIVNPKKPECPSKFKEFCSSGLVLLFLSRLRKCLGCDVKLDGRYQALAALGTVVDVVPLVEGNRILVANGLSAINRKLSLPIENLAKTAGIADRGITASNLAFMIAPRLNVGKRGLVNPLEVYRFLMEERPDVSMNFAERLHQANRQRQMLEDEVLRDVLERLPCAPKGRALIMAGEGWSHGVVGIVASRLIDDEHHYGPVILLAPDSKTGLLVGSGRSISGVDLHEALLFCEDLLERWGGHRQAAGVSLKPENLVPFQKRMEKVLSLLPADLFVPCGAVDAVVPHEAVTREFVDSLAKLEPHGCGNPRPNFAVAAPVSGLRVMGSLGNHLEIFLGQNGRRLRAVWWSGAAFREALEGFAEGLVIGKVNWSGYWNAPELVVEDVVKSN